MSERFPDDGSPGPGPEGRRPQGGEPRDADPGNAGGGRPDGSEPDVELSAPEARQSVKLGHMRWVLRIGLVLVVIGLLGAWLGVWA